MTPATFRRRLVRLENCISERRRPRVSFWDVLCGAVSTENLAPEDIEGWDKIGPAIEEAQRLAEQPDPFEEAIRRICADASGEQKQG